MFIDCAPSSGTFNRSIVLSCDYILPPSFADEFSCKSTEQLLKALLPNWFEWADKIRASDSYEKYSKLVVEHGIEIHNIKTKNPKILPIIVQNYKKYKDKITSAHSRWINHLESIINELNVEWRTKNMITLKESVRVIALIPNLAQLTVVSGEISVPLPFMKLNDLPNSISITWAEKKLALNQARLRARD